MEALTAASVACPTVYDMCKASRPRHGDHGRAPAQERRRQSPALGTRFLILLMPRPSIGWDARLPSLARDDEGRYPWQKRGGLVNMIHVSKFAGFRRPGVFGRFTREGRNHGSDRTGSEPMGFRQTASFLPLRGGFLRHGLVCTPYLVECCAFDESTRGRTKRKPDSRRIAKRAAYDRCGERRTSLRCLRACGARALSPHHGGYSSSLNSPLMRLNGPRRWRLRWWRRTPTTMPPMATGSPVRASFFACGVSVDVDDPGAKASGAGRARRRIRRRLGFGIGFRPRVGRRLGSGEGSGSGRDRASAAATASLNVRAAARSGGVRHRVAPSDGGRKR